MEYILVDGSFWEEEARKIMANKDIRLTALFANDERPVYHGMAVYAIFSDRQNHCHRGLKTLLFDEPWELPSLVPVTPAAAWYEREMHDLFGIIPTGHPDLRPLVLHENWSEGFFPLCKDFSPPGGVPFENREFPMPAVEGNGVFEVPVGPIHAGIIEPGHFRFSQAGEHIINLEAKLFFTHRGIEKAVEGLDVKKALLQAERICGACTVSHAFSYSEALESIAGVKVPREAQLGRVVIAELERLYNHIGDIGNLCAGLGLAIGTSHGGRLKEKMMRLNESIAGNRFLRGMIIPGGLQVPITPLMAEDILAVIREVEPDFKQLIAMLQDHEAFLDRVNTTGVVPYEAAVDLALVGVGARASGVSTDVRRDFPYAAYDKLDFIVPVYSQGDVASRLWVRADETIQSFDLIRQALDHMDGSSDWLCTLPSLPPLATGFGCTESPRGSNFHWIMTGKNNTLYRLFVRSASYPNWPALAVAAPGNIIPDFPLINKSFELCYACIDR